MDGLLAADDMDDAEDGDWRNLLEAMWKKVPEIEPADAAPPGGTGPAAGDAADASAKPASGGLTLGDVVGDGADAGQRGAPPEPAADAAPGGAADAGREAAPREPAVRAAAGTGVGRGADKGAGSILGGLAVDELAEEGPDTSWGTSILQLLELPEGHEEDKRGADIVATDFVGGGLVEIDDDSAEEAAEVALGDEGIQPTPAHPFHAVPQDPRQVPRGARSTAPASPVRGVGASLARMTATKSAPSKPARPLRDPALPGLAYQKRSALPLGPAALPWPKVARSGGGGPAAPAILMASSTKAPPPRPPSRGMSVDEDLGSNRPEEQAHEYDTQCVVVDFVNVGTTFAQEVLGQAADGDCPFDWKGVRDCVRHLQGQLGLKVVGVITDNLLGSEMASQEKYGLPFDIRMMCDSVQMADGLEGASCHLTVTCAYKRNCRFITDMMWEQVEELDDDGCRSWFQDHRGLLQMQYAFDCDDGSFSIVDEDTQA